ncbi:MAG: hypothetical protein LH650_04995 [Chloroflexi bacterium]|nr:hypothetical protein [Chloroflexota bacterium]
MSNPRTAGMQDTLRSLGAVLDAHRARSVYIREVSTGLLVRATVTTTLDERIVGAWQPLERLYTDGALFEQQVAAVARRGSGHQAGPLERALRLIGRQSDERSLRGLTVIQHHTDDGWMIWHDGSRDGRPELFSMTTSELWTFDAQVRSQAGRPAPALVGEI